MLAAKMERAMERYIDELSSRSKWHGNDKKRFEEETLNDLRQKVEENIKSGMKEKEALDKAMSDLQVEIPVSSKETSDEPEEYNPATLFSLVMSMVVALACVWVFVGGTIAIIASLGIILGLGYAIIDYLHKHKRI